MHAFELLNYVVICVGCWCCCYFVDFVVTLLLRTLLPHVVAFVRLAAWHLLHAHGLPRIYTLRTPFGFAFTGYFTGLHARWADFTRCGTRLRCYALRAVARVGYVTLGAHFERVPLRNVELYVHVYCTRTFARVTVATPSWFAVCSTALRCAGLPPRAFTAFTRTRVPARYTHAPFGSAFGLLPLARTVTQLLAHGLRVLYVYGYG